MNEAATSFLKVLSALTSPKAAIKYISVAIFVLFSWQFVINTVAEFNAPAQYAELISLFLGLGLGSLAGEMIWFVVVFFKTLFTDRRQRLISEKAAVIKAEEERLKLEKKKAELLERFKKAYAYFSSSARDRMRSLISDERCWDATDAEVVNLEIQHYVVKVTRVDGRRSLYRMSEFLVDYVREHWAEEIDRNVNEFFGDMTEDKNKLLRIMSGSLGASEVVSWHSFNQHLPPIAPCFNYECNALGMSVSFRYPYLEHFSIRSGLDLQEHVSLSGDRLS